MLHLNKEKINKTLKKFDFRFMNVFPHFKLNGKYGTQHN